ncbi:MAG: ECF transporter S component [Lachnospiraceae bacterium]|nr:ECF transporter S component [Lachnospiraceae bacterium]
MNRKVNTTVLVEMAVLIAIIVIMAFTPVGYIRTGALSITLIVIPVAVGAVVLGPRAGAVLGAVFGITSFIQCFGLEPFGTALFGIKPFGTFVVCLLPRVLMGWLSGFIYVGFCKIKGTKGIAIFIGNLAAPILNTIFFMASLVVIFRDYLTDQYAMKNIFSFVVAFVGINGLIEAAVCFLVGSAISGALKKVLRQ